MAEITAKRSKCAKLKVGAIIQINDRPISAGYNGSPSGFQNCEDVFKTNLTGHSDWTEKHEIHAEMNALLYAAKVGIATAGSTLYCTHIPCHNCLKHIIQAGVKRVVYVNDHYNVVYEQETLNLITASNITVEKYEQK